VRLLLFLLAICAGIVWIGTQAEAQNYPWCAQYSGGSTGGAIAALSALRSALPLSAELAGSAFKIIHINLLQDRAIIREFKGAILI